MKKFLALLLALVMVLGLAACAPKDSGETQPKDTKPADTQPTDTTPTEPDDGIIPADQLAHDTAVKVQLVMPDNNRADRDVIAEAAVKYVKEQLNIDLEIVWIPKGETPNTVLSTGKGWDLGYCDSALFQNLSARNAFLDLGSYIEKGYLAYPVENLTDGQKAGHVIDGKQVGFAPIKDLAEGWNWIYNATVIEEQLGLTVPEWQSGFDMVQHWYDIKEAAKGTEWEDCVIGGPGQFYLPFWFQFDGIVGAWNDVLVATNIDLEKMSSFDDIDPMKAFCPYFTEDFAEWCKLRKQLVDDGIEWGYKQDSGDGRNYKNGGYLFTSTCGWLTYFNESEDYLLKMTNQKSAYSYTGYLQAVSVVVNANTENPERVLELMNLMYASDYWNTLWRAGIEGTHWVDSNNDGVVEWTEENPGGKKARNWFPNGLAHSLYQGSVDPAECPTKEEFVNALKALNENSIVTPHLGFTFDQTNVVNEISACAGVVTEYMNQLLYPAAVNDVDATIKAFQDKLIANGVEKVIAEVQAQLDAFHTAK